MQKLWFAALLTIAVVFAQANNGGDNKTGTVKSNTPNPKKGGKKKTSDSVELPPSSFGVETPRDVKTGGKSGGKKGTKKGSKKGPSDTQQPPAKRPAAAK